MTTQTTIKLGTTDLDVFQLPDGSYAAPGLFRLYTTNVYLYEGTWYYLSPDGLPDMAEFTYWDPRVEGYLAFDYNKLAYIHFYSADPERDICEEGVEFDYVPVPADIYAVIDFCDLGNIVPDDVMCQLHRKFEECYSSDPLICKVNRTSLFRDTANYLPSHLLE